MHIVGGCSAGYRLIEKYTISSLPFNYYLYTGTPIEISSRAFLFKFSLTVILIARPRRRSTGGTAYASLEGFRTDAKPQIRVVDTSTPILSAPLCFQVPTFMPARVSAQLLTGADSIDAVATISLAVPIMIFAHAFTKAPSKVTSSAVSELSS